MTIRVGIVNDVRLSAEVLRRVVSSDSLLAVCWIASDGLEAVRLCREQPPDIVLMDLVMPRMNGVEATREIMATTPCPILVVTSTVEGHLDMVYEAMGLGARDVVTTPTTGDPRSGDTGGLLLRKIHTLLRLADDARAMTPVAGVAAPDTAMRVAARPPLVAIGASTGGPAAVATIIAALPRGFRAAVVVVQHIDNAFVEGLCDWLGSRCALPVRIAAAGAAPLAGTIHVSAAARHLRLSAAGTFDYTDAAANAFYRPSVDVFLDSAACHAPPGSVGILLTGMGRDGAEGLLAMRRAGFHTIAQSASSCVVAGMPVAAVELGAATAIATPDAIAAWLDQNFAKVG